MFVDSARYPCFLLCNNFKEFIVKEKSAALYLYLPAATKVAKVMFLQVFVCQQGGGGVRGCWGHAWLLGGVCVVAGGHVWLLGGVWLPGGMRGKGGHAWQRGVHSEGGMRGEGGHVWDTTRYGDTINERAVRILLECILVNVKVLNILVRPEPGTSSHVLWFVRT